MDAFAGAIGVSDSDGKATPVYCVCEPRPTVEVHYFAYLLREMARSGWIRVLAKGIRERSCDFRWSDFGAQRLPVPPALEQRGIVQVLEQVSRRIRQTIGEKQHIADLLEEERQVVVHETVTRGVDASVRLRASGVPWLGSVPEHWAFGRLRSHADVRVSNVDKHSRDYEHDVRLCNYVDVYYNDFIRSEMPFMRATASTAEIERFGLVRGDVLITKDSEAWNDIGVPALVSDTSPDLVSGYHLAILRPHRDRLLGEYLLRVLQSRLAYQFHVSAKGVTRYGLSYSDIKSIRLPVPPLQEQEAIVRHLAQVTTDIDAALAGVRREIELLKEYRARLIADVVTGRLDVREAADRLPGPNEEGV